MEGVNPTATKSLCLLGGGGVQKMTWRIQVGLGKLGGETFNIYAERGNVFKRRVTDQNSSDYSNNPWQFHNRYMCKRDSAKAATNEKLGKLLVIVEDSVYCLVY